MSTTMNKRVLISGGNGFIGSHLAQRLRNDGHDVVVVDRNSIPSINHGCKVVVGNLCDLEFCRSIVQNVDTLFHLAANMGGMGVIHQANDFSIYPENHTMTLNLFSVAVEAGVRSFFFASSACVYPDRLQDGSTLHVSLREEDTWGVEPTCPQGLYGLEKLNVENILRMPEFRTRLDISIARFHNIFGPGGAWNNGREKAPAALLRKAIALQMLGRDAKPMEIWGDGTQRRSFLYVHDCIDAIIRLWQTPDDRSISPLTLNIGSDQPISIRDLAFEALEAAGLDRTFQLEFDGGKPIGVASRNSNNDLARKKLGGWKPRFNMRQGLEEMLPWLRSEIELKVQSLSQEERRTTLERLCQSDVVVMENDKVTFAILLPVTTLGSPSVNTLFESVRTFARSLYTTTYREVHELGAQVRFQLKIYVAVDHDDANLVCESQPIVQILRSENLWNVVQKEFNTEKGHVCELWRQTARMAYEDGCDYFVLMGDDVVIDDCGWMKAAHDKFQDFSETNQVPFGVGCVAFTDTSFPGMPTFPIIHRTHMDIFQGEVVSSDFINQDGDPFLFQLYRRFGCSVMMDKRLRNTVGGGGDARYSKVHSQKWTFRPLSNGVARLTNWLQLHKSPAQPKLVLDVIVPSYRVSLQDLGRIIALQSSPTYSVMFIIIVDNPHTLNTELLESRYAQRPDIRIRRNTTNLGASASRNRGLKESAADWVLFLDDDIEPAQDLLIKAEQVIRAHPNAAGFVGNSKFPVADTVTKAAVHLAGVTYFWDIAEKLNEKASSDVPWGVTANLIARRDVDDGVEFDLRFPKTGGGEDIAFCRDKREKALARGLDGFHVAPDVMVTHPWWNNGQRNYRRFYMWAYGDGALIKMYPNLTYWDYAPNSAELLLLSSLLILVGMVLVPFGYGSVLSLGWNLAMSTIIVNVIHDCYRHLVRDVDRTKRLDITVTGMRWGLAVMESAFLRMSSEVGRVVGLLSRNEFGLLCQRFDWFTGKVGDGPKREERKNGVQKLGMVILVMLWIQPMYT